MPTYKGGTLRTMAELGSCTKCGAPLRPGYGAGLCPACLLQQALVDGDVESSSATDLVPGGLVAGTILGSFRIARLVGKGGMAAVYEAFEAAPLERTVALKVLPPEFLHDDTFAKRFMQEARVVASLEHPNIVPIYASGIDNGIPWISMRMFTGGSLATLLDGQGRLGIERTTALLRDIGNALDYAHARGVIHRDLKPSNILMDDAGRAYICDFGLARLIQGRERWTRTGNVTGTPQYMAPEQALGGVLDHRCDIYGFGVLAYEMLCGTTPFHGDTPVATLMQHANAPLPVPPSEFVPEPLFRSLKKALAKKPDDRWSSAAEFVSAFQAVAAVPAHARKQRLVPALKAAALAILVVASLWSASKMVGFLIPTQQGTPPSATDIPGAVEHNLALDDRSLWNTTVPPSDAPVDSPRSPDDRPPLRGGTPTASGSKDGRTTSPRTPQTPVNGDGLRVNGAEGSQQDRGDTPSAGPGVTSGPGDVAGSTKVDGDGKSLAAADGGPREPPNAGGVQVDPGPAGPVSAKSEPATLKPESDVVSQPIRLWAVNPVYPDVARAAQIEGDVLVLAVIGPDGRVTQAEILRSVHPALNEAARQAVLQYRYTPGRRNGEPDTFKIQVPISFRLK
jgi:TonB family protein